jgi:hypothetical protein
MERQSFFRRVILPIALVIGVMVLSSHIYDAARHITNRTLHSILAHTGASLMFLSIWLGAIFGNTIAFFRGAGFGERLLVCLVPPLIWSAKILADLVGIFTTGEFFYLFLHHFILGCPLVALLCMGVSEIWCRIIAVKKNGNRSIKVFALNNTSLLAISFILVFLMLWKGGHTYYYLYLDFYTKIFL